MFDHAPNTDPDPNEHAVIMLDAPALLTVIQLYADPANWDYDGTWTGPGNGPSLAQMALRKPIE